MSLICFSFWPKSQVLKFCQYVNYLPLMSLSDSSAHIMTASAETRGWTHPRYPLTPPPSLQYVLQYKWIEIRFFTFLFDSPYPHNTFRPFWGCLYIVFRRHCPNPNPHTEWTARGPWRDIHWIWQRVYWIRIVDYTFNSALFPPQSRSGFKVMYKLI